MGSALVKLWRKAQEGPTKPLVYQSATQGKQALVIVEQEKGNKIDDRPRDAAKKPRGYPFAP